MLGALLGSGDQLRRSNAERDGQRCNGGERRSALATLDPADVVAVDAAVEAKALLRDVLLVA